MDIYTTTHQTENRRVKWVYDYEYQSEGSYAYATEEETKAAIAWEQERLEDGRLIALGAIVEVRCSHCESWRDVDSLWGIVVSPEENLERLGSEILEIPK